jgi:hypothetical protein
MQSDDLPGPERRKGSVEGCRGITVAIDPDVAHPAEDGARDAVVEHLPHGHEAHEPASLAGRDAEEDEVQMPDVIRSDDR